MNLNEAIRAIEQDVKGDPDTTDHVTDHVAEAMRVLVDHARNGAGLRRQLDDVQDRAEHERAERERAWARCLEAEYLFAFAVYKMGGQLVVDPVDLAGFPRTTVIHREQQSFSRVETFTVEVPAWAREKSVDVVLALERVLTPSELPPLFVVDGWTAEGRQDVLVWATGQDPGTDRLHPPEPLASWLKR